MVFWSVYGDFFIHCYGYGSGFCDGCGCYFVTMVIVGNDNNDVGDVDIDGDYCQYGDCSSDELLVVAMVLFGYRLMQFFFLIYNTDGTEIHSGNNLSRYKERRKLKY